MTRSRRRANSAIEVALTLPLFLTLLAGVLEWGLVLPRQALVEHCARDAARAGALTESADAPAAAAAARARQRLAESGLDPDSATIDATVISSAVGDLISVEISLPYPPLLGLVPTGATLEGTGRMRLEDQ